MMQERTFKEEIIDVLYSLDESGFDVKALKDIYSPIEDEYREFDNLVDLVKYVFEYENISYDDEDYLKEIISESLNDYKKIT